MSNQAGKGDKPRNCFSRQFKDRFEEIDWGHGSKKKTKKVVRRKNK